MEGAKLRSIVDGCLLQDPLSQRKLYSFLHDRMIRVCLPYHKNRGLVEDAVQEGFIKVFRSIHTFRGDVAENMLEKVLFYWIKRIMQNTMIDKLRREKNKPVLIQFDHSLADHLIEDPRDIDDADTIEMKVKTVVKLIEELPPSLSKVSNLILVEGYTHQQVADALGISVGTSKGYFFRAKERIKIMLDKRYGLR